MSHLLILYEIGEKASKVTSSKSLHDFEKWVYDTIKVYQDSAIERAARIHLFRLKEQYKLP